MLPLAEVLFWGRKLTHLTYAYICIFIMKSPFVTYALETKGESGLKV